MILKVQEEAAQWYKNELELEDNDSLRFFVRYGGVGGLQPGMSLGVRPDSPAEPIAEDKQEGIRFYVEQEDAWYFDHYNVTVKYDRDKQEPDFDYYEPENES